MSSSDSDDDCYGNASKKLQNMINNYKEDKIETVNLLKGSKGISNIPADAGDVTKTLSVNDSENIETIVISGKNDSLYEDDVILDQIIALNSFRQTRSRTKRGAAAKEATDSPVRVSTGAARARGSPRSRGRGRGRARIARAASSCLPINIAEPNAISRTPRPRSRPRNTAQRARSTYTSYPYFSVGNTDEYPDLSDNVQLFNSKTQPEEVIDDVLDENEELSIKVYWQSSEIVKFTIRKFQKISQIFDFFANRENVNPDRLLLTYNDKILKPDDTPDKINYNIAKFIDGGIVNCVPSLIDEENKIESGIKIKFQCQNVKKPFTIFVQKTEKLKQAMVKCAEHLDKPLQLLKFQFDGDSITGAMTAEDLELEGGECIDVKIVS